MKIVKQYINEKFTEDSDPIYDMGIGIEEAIKLWLLEKDWDIKNFDRYELFSRCIIYHKFDFAKYILKKYNLNIDYNDCHFLRVAAYKKNEECIKFLLKNGADLDEALEYALRKDEKVTHQMLSYVKRNYDEFSNKNNNY